MEKEQEILVVQIAGVGKGCIPVDFDNRKLAERSRILGIERCSICRQKELKGRE